MLAAAQRRAGSGDELLHKSLAVHFIPFRSPTFKALARRRESLDFAHALWKGLFNHLDPQLIITIDRRTTDRLRRILQEKLGCDSTCERHPVGWGDYTAELISFDSGGRPRTILRFPHLSRFKLFGRPQSAAHIGQILRAVAQAR